MTTVQRVAQVFGVVFLLVGVIGFFADGGMTMGTTGTGIFGLFPVNILHNCVHLAFGVWGIVAARTFAGAQMYGKVGGIIYIALAILGLLPATSNVFGLIPIGGNDVALHGLLGIVLAGVGFTAKQESAATA